MSNGRDPITSWHATFEEDGPVTCYEHVWFEYGDPMGALTLTPWKPHLRFRRCILCRLEQVYRMIEEVGEGNYRVRTFDYVDAEI